MSKVSNIYSSETISKWNETTMTRGVHRTKQVNITNDWGTIIYGVHICIRRRLWRSVDGTYRGPRYHSMEAIMDPRG